MRTTLRVDALALLGVIALAAWSSRPTMADGDVEMGRGIRVIGASSAQLDLARWATGRFADVGLELPSVDIEFHDDLAGCGGHLGFARDGRVDICTSLVNAMTRRNLLHEMSHIWLDQYTDSSTRAAFLQARGLTSWNSSDDEWRYRGYEQGAEIIAWALGERILSAQVPDSDVQGLARAFGSLTGRPLPE